MSTSANNSLLSVGPSNDSDRAELRSFDQGDIILVRFRGNPKIRVLSIHHINTTSRPPRAYVGEVDRTVVDGGAELERQLDEADGPEQALDILRNGVVPQVLQYIEAMISRGEEWGGRALALETCRLRTEHIETIWLHPTAKEIIDALLALGTPAATT